MPKLFASLATTALVGASLLASSSLAHAASTMPANDDTHINVGCYVNWQHLGSVNGVIDTTKANGYPGEWTHVNGAITDVTDPTLLADGYTKQMTVHNRIEMDAGLNDMNLTLQYMSSRVGPQDTNQENTAFVSVVNTSPADADAVPLTDAELVQANDPKQQAQITGITIPENKAIEWDYTVASRDGSFDGDAITGASSGYMDGFLNLDSGGCRDIEVAKAVAGTTDYTPIAHTTLQSDTGWTADGTRTVVLAPEDPTWRFSDHDKDVYGAESRKVLTGEEKDPATVTIVYTKAGAPVVTTHTEPTYGDKTVYTDKQVTTTTDVVTGQDKVTWVQADVYGDHFRKGTYDNGRKRTRDEKLTPAQMQVRNNLIRDFKLLPNEDRVLWGSATSAIIPITGAEELKYGSIEKAAMHDLGWTHVDHTVSATATGDLHELFVLGTGASKAAPFGPNHTVAQTEVSKAPSMLTHTTKTTTSTVKVATVLHNQVIGSHEVTTTTPGTPGTVSWTYQQPTAN